jgi:hypothetical protein
MTRPGKREQVKKPKRLFPRFPPRLEILPDFHIPTATAPGFTSNPHGRWGWLPRKNIGLQAEGEIFSLTSPFIEHLFFLPLFAPKCMAPA